jgi:ketosteroid isomerase-like protein
MPFRTASPRSIPLRSHLPDSMPTASKPIASKSIASMPLRTALAAALLFLAACAPRRIPGTDIPDTSDTQAILGVIRQYVAATEARDAQKVLSLVSPSYSDDAGTTSPEDDLDYTELQQVLPQRLAALKDVKLDVSVRRIDLEGDTARVVFFYNQSYRAPGITQRAQSDSDLNEMVLRREGGRWKIVSGL